MALMAGSREGHESPSPVHSVPAEPETPAQVTRDLQESPALSWALGHPWLHVAASAELMMPRGRLGWAGSRPGGGAVVRLHQPRLHRWLLKRSAASRALASHRLSRRRSLHPRRVRPRPRQPRWSSPFPTGTAVIMAKKTRTYSLLSMLNEDYF